MYRPKTGDAVVWVWQDGAFAAHTKFTDNGDAGKDRDISSPQGKIDRYGDPRPAFRARPEAAGGANIDTLLADPNAETFFRFQLDPDKGELPGLLRVAAEHGNPWGIELLSDPLLSVQQAMDFAAAGDIGKLRADYAQFLGDVGGTGGTTSDCEKKLADIRAKAGAWAASKPKTAGAPLRTWAADVKKWLDETAKG